MVLVDDIHREDLLNLVQLPSDIVASCLRKQGHPSFIMCGTKEPRNQRLVHEAVPLYIPTAPLPSLLLAFADMITPLPLTEVLSATLEVMRAVAKGLQPHLYDDVFSLHQLVTLLHGLSCMSGTAVLEDNIASWMRECCTVYCGMHILLLS